MPRAPAKTTARDDAKTQRLRRHDQMVCAGWKNVDFVELANVEPPALRKELQAAWRRIVARSAAQVERVVLPPQTAAIAPLPPPAQSGEATEQSAGPLERILQLRALVPVVFSPIVAVSQLYTAQTLPTALDTEIAQLVRDGTLTRLAAPAAAGHEEAVLLGVDYRRILQRALRSGAGGAPPVAQSVAERFLNVALLATTVDVSRAQLTEQLECSEDDLTALCACSLLAVHDQPERFYWAVPGFAPFLAHLRAGVRHLLSSLARLRAMELPFKQLALRRLPACRLPWALVVSHGVGQGLLLCVASPAGLVIRLTRRGALSGRGRAGDPLLPR